MWTDPFIVLGALAVEAAIGYPLSRHIPHPVVGVGWMIAAMDRHWNRGFHPQRMFGVVTLLVVTVTSALVGWLLQRIGLESTVGVIAVILFGTLGLAQRSLHDHVTAVAKALENGDLDAARSAVAMIVGRDTQSLNETGVASAAIESLAESFNDGVVAPVCWFSVAGLAGLFGYKAVNTADSMIGHKDRRYAQFGWAAARTDDIANLIPARLAGLMIVIAARRGGAVMWRDARKHASPNSGWPEAAMAGALGVTLGGPVSYDGVVTGRAVLGEGREPTSADLKRALGTYRLACGLLWLCVAIGGLLWRR